MINNYYINYTVNKKINERTSCLRLIELHVKRTERVQGYRQSPRARRCSPLWLQLRGCSVTPRLGLSSVLSGRVAQWSSLGTCAVGASGCLGPESPHACFMPWETELCPACCTIIFNI